METILPNLNSLYDSAAIIIDSGFGVSNIVRDKTGKYELGQRLTEDEISNLMGNREIRVLEVSGETDRIIDKNF